MEQEIGTWDSVLLENISEDNFVSNLHQRYKRDHIYTYIGTSLVAINPYRQLSHCSSDVVRSYGSKGIFQLSPHIFGLANIAYQSLKNQSEDQCVILTGESGSGKTESFQMILQFLTEIQETSRTKSKYQTCSRRRGSSSCPANSGHSGQSSRPNSRPSSRSNSRPNSRPSTPKPNQSPIFSDKSTNILIKARSESSDRSSNKKYSKEKMVDFDFSHHKSTENISFQCGSIGLLKQHHHPSTTSIATMTTPTATSSVLPKSCFKHNHIDAMGRSKTLTTVDYCLRKSSCDLSKNNPPTTSVGSTNKYNENIIIVPNKATASINLCCAKSLLGQEIHSKSLPHQHNCSRESSNVIHHTKCLRQKSLEINDDGQSSILSSNTNTTTASIHCSTTSIPATVLKSAAKNTIADSRNVIHRGSCVNLCRQQQQQQQQQQQHQQQHQQQQQSCFGVGLATDVSRDGNNMRSACSNNSPFIHGDPYRLSSRISLIDAHKLGLRFVEREQAAASKSTLTGNPNYIYLHKDWMENTKTQKLRDRVINATVFLEAMGNATTNKNGNSSRYGKFFDIEIDYKGDPIGIHISHYLLEKTRVTNVITGERNFHIFYQMLHGADIQFLKSLKLYRNIEKYELLKNTSATEDDKSCFLYSKKSLEIIGLSSEEIVSVFRVLAAVLKLGNFIFVPITNIDGTEGCQVSNDYELEETAQLLNIDENILLHCLTRVSTVCARGHEDNGSELDARQASLIRNTLCRTLYSRLFTWIVNRINETLKSNQREKNLAILDFYGFEILEFNLFEQFTINYCMEKIHQHFIQNVLKLEQELYLREGLEWNRIDFFDNETISELIDKPNYGILSLINESHINNDEALLIRIQQCCAGHPNFLTCGPTKTSMSFKIRHFANVVTYSIQGFLEKNSDTLPKNISSGLYQSKLSLVQSLFPEGNPKRSSKKPTSLSSNLRTQLQTLLSIVKNRRNHYVFCIKPNETKQPRIFDMALVQHQVRYMSLMPLVNLYRNGHCFHLPHAKFFNRYKLLNNLTWPHFTHGSTIEGIALIIRSVPLPSAEFTIGSKHVFVRSPRTIYELEEFRKTRLDDLAILIQKTFRMYVRRKSFKKLRESQIIISSAWRTWRECRFGIPFTGRRHLWSLYRIARDEYRSMKYQKQLEWAVKIICDHYRSWRIRNYFLTLPLRLPPNTLSPLSLEWPSAPKFLLETSRILRSIYHRWRCYIYRRSFDQTSRNRMREKVTASIIFKDRKASYPRSVGHPFVGDYVRLRHNLQWKKYCMETNDQYVVFADIVNKITRSNGKFVPILLVLSTSSMLLLDQRTLQVKYRVPAAEIYRMSLSPYLDDIAVFHVKADHYCASDHQCSSDSPSGCLFQSELGRKKGDFVFQTGHVIEIVTKMFLVIQNATGKPPDVHISTEFEANFGQQTVIFTFKYGGISELPQGQPKVTRRGNRMEIVV